MSPHTPLGAVIVERIQTGVRLEKRMLKVLKALADSLDMTLGDLLEGIVLHAFEGKAAFSKPTLAKAAELRRVFDLTLTAEDAHHLKEKPDVPELLDRFVDTTLPADQFHHRQHVQVAWLFVRNHGMPAALAEFQRGDQAIRRCQGRDRSVPRDHHLGIPAADRRSPGTHAGRHLGRVRSRQPGSADVETVDSERYYSKELLASELARRTFLMPDRI